MSGLARPTAKPPSYRARNPGQELPGDSKAQHRIWPITARQFCDDPHLTAGLQPGTVMIMFAVYAARIDADDPLSGLETGERPDPEQSAGWATVTVKATALNHHDVWSLRGVGLAADR